MSNRKPFHSRFDYVVPTPDTASVPTSPTRKPDSRVRERFAKLHAEVYDGEGRLRPTFRPSPKPAKKSTSPLFQQQMSGRCELYRFVP